MWKPSSRWEEPLKPNIDYSLYLVTDRPMLRGAPLEQAVEKAIRGGCTLVQLREKDASSREFYEQAERVKRVADRHGVPLIINDRADIAVAVGAAGVHVGQSDLPLSVVRGIVGPDMVVGVSATTFAEAREAVERGADYLGVGAMFATGTKTEAGLTSMAELRRMRDAFSLPIVVIGGIHAENAPVFRQMGVDGLAVVSAILAQDDIEQAARTLRIAFSNKGS